MALRGLEFGHLRPSERRSEGHCRFASDFFNTLSPSSKASTNAQRGCSRRAPSGGRGRRARWGYQWLLLAWGRLLLAQGDLEQAAGRLRKSLRLSHIGNDPRTITSCLDRLAGVLALAHADATTTTPLCAARVLGAAAKMRAGMGTPVAEIDRSTHDQAMAATRAALGERAFEAAFAEGQAMSRDEAVAYALDEQPSA